MKSKVYLFLFIYFKEIVAGLSKHLKSWTKDDFYKFKAAH